MELISIIIPTYNRALLLKNAIESVLTQTYERFSLSIIDDGSEDATSELVHSIHDTRIKYIHQTHAGVSAARNHGIQTASGTWLAFLDSDDYWLPQKLMEQVAFIKHYPEYLIHQTEEIWIRNGKRVNPMKKHRQYDGMIYEKCLPLCIISPSSVMIHRSIFDTVGLFDEALPACEDYDLWLRIAAHYPVGLIRKPLIVKQGGHPDQLSHRYPALDRFRIQALHKMLTSSLLPSDYYHATVHEFKKKCAIYAQGARKRGNYEDAEHYTNLSTLF